MTALVDDPDFTLHVGDALDVLRTLPDESVHCCVTSPPYWGLRDYGIDGQLGLEETPELYVARMVEVFREVRRVLRRDGTCWLNIGSSYMANPSGSLEGSTLTKGGKQTASSRAGRAARRDAASRDSTCTAPQGSPRRLKPKDMVPTPWMLAMALQQDGWYLRSDVIWSKCNPMPESVTDRPTKAHEYLFLLTREPRYFYDADAIREPAEWARWGDQTNGKHQDTESAASWIPDRKVARRPPLVPEQTKAGVGRQGIGSDTFGHYAERGRNRRSVWEIATEPYPDAHFATFPQKLVEPCILAGTSERGCCPECRAPWQRVVEVESSWRLRAENGATRGNLAPETLVGAGTQRAVHGAGVSHDLNSRRREQKGWRPTCECGDESGVIGWVGTVAHETVPCTVLDPFLGSGTVALVARRLGRRCIGIELNPGYAAQAAKRTRQLSLLA